ncbi:MAG: DUF2169 domain-containing protein [Deltaproteobacteria bacterium]|nr:DUF2169 domain-containing protein [Deltaproteobacteria bacterium]
MLRPDGAGVLAPSDLVPRRAQVDVTVAGIAAVAAGSSSGTTTVGLTVRQGGRDVIAKVTEVAVGQHAGLSAIAAMVPARSDLLTGASLKPDAGGFVNVPASLSAEYFQAAPADQRLDSLDGNAFITLQGMHPGGQTIVAQLPGVAAEGALFGLTPGQPKAGVLLAFRADTVVVDVERLLCSVVWRAEVSLPNVALVESLTAAAGVATLAHKVTVPRSLDEVSASDAGDQAPPSATVAFSGNIADLLPPGGDATMGLDPKAVVPSSLPFGKPKATQASKAANWAAKLGATGGVTPAGTDAARPKPPPPKRAAPKPETLGDADIISVRNVSPSPDTTMGPRSASQQEEALPFAKPQDGARPPVPVAAGWAAKLGGADDGQTITFTGNREDSVDLPFADMKKAAAEAAARRAAEQQAAAEEAEREAQRKAEAAKKAEQERKAAETKRRQEEEERRFAEEQRQAKEREAQRRAEAKKKERDDAEELADALYGGFGPKSGKG